jgi:N,N'-diacetyllegionaminate synthase
MKGPDHKASIDPFMLKALVRSIRNIEKSIGNPKKIPSKAEYENILIVRKSIVAKQKIKIGEKFTENNITTKRPANGLSPMFWDQIIGKISDRDYKKDDFIKI